MDDDDFMNDLFGDADTLAGAATSAGSVAIQQSILNGSTPSYQAVTTTGTKNNSLTMLLVIGLIIFLVVKYR